MGSLFTFLADSSWMDGKRTADSGHHGDMPAWQCLPYVGTFLRYRYSLGKGFFFVSFGPVWFRRGCVQRDKEGDGPYLRGLRLLLSFKVFNSRVVGGWTGVANFLATSEDITRNWDRFRRCTARLPWGSGAWRSTTTKNVRYSSQLVWCRTVRQRNFRVVTLPMLRTHMEHIHPSIHMSICTYYLQIYPDLWKVKKEHNDDGDRNVDHHHMFIPLHLPTMPPHLSVSLP